MISAKTFNQLEILCRHVRHNYEYFGGIQVILAGDFYQLPPVANEIIGDPGNHCFKLSWFNNRFPHKVKLHTIHRQSDITLIKCINELEVGDPSDESVAFLKSLDRPLLNEEKCIHLFVTVTVTMMLTYSIITIYKIYQENLKFLKQRMNDQNTI